MLLPRCFILFIYLFLSFHRVHFVSSCLSFQLLHPIRLPLPFLKSFISLLLSFCFQSYLRFVYLFLSFQHIHFIASVLSLQLFPSIRCCLPFVNSLKSRSLPLPFRFSSSLLFPIRRSFCFNLFSSVCYFPRIPSTRPTCSFTSSFHFKALISYDFVTSCLSLQRFHPVCLPLPFVSSRSFRYLLPFASTLLSCSSCSSFPFSVHFIASVLSLQHFPSIRYFLPFVSKLPSRSFASSCRFIIASVSTRTSRVLQAWKTRVAASGCFFEFQPPRVLQQCYSF